MKLQSPQEQIRQASLRLLKYRDRSTREMRERLHRKGFDSSLIEMELAWLLEQRLLDDEKFVSVWIRHKLAISHKGKRLIAAELSAKGINSDLFRKVWTEYPEEESRSASEWARAHASGYNLLELYERRGRIRESLYRRGYSEEAIEKALKEIG
jgi:regulatory protein